MGAVITPTNSGLDYGSFKNNTSTGYHLQLQCTQTISTTGCSFDTTTLYDVNAGAGAVITFTNYTNSRAGTDTGAGTVYWVTTGQTLYAIQTGTWNNVTTWDTDPNAIPPGSGPVPASGDNATITPTVTVTMTNGSWACANLTNNGTLDFDMNAGDVALTIDNGGVVFNSGTINFAAAGLGNKVTLQVADPTNPNMWIYEGNVPTWVDDLNIDLGDCDCRPILQFSDKITLTIIGNLKTYGDAELYGNASG
ncbi:unnamed protein product, partial [marine sediment metagenome]